jgi:ABC-type transport system substrate-binding protein
MALKEDAYYAQGVPERTFNLAKAKQLLADAGYPKGFKTVLHSDTRGNKDQATAIQTYLKAAGIDATIDMADPGRFNTLTQSGWDGLLMPGFPNISNTSALASRFGSMMNFNTMYRTPGFIDRWIAVLAQTDDNIRVDQTRTLIKEMAENCMTIPIYETHPAYATNGTVKDIQWITRKNAGFWNPSEVWLTK